MGEASKIEWTDATFNPWVGCTKISPGCDNCYAEGWAKRSGMVTWGGSRRLTSASNWQQPIKWNRQATAEGVRKRVFCASLADVFDNEVDPMWRHRLFALIRATPNLDWLLLTKRIGNVKGMVPDDWAVNIPGVRLDGYPNVWLGISVVNQEEAERDIPKLLAVPAAIRFLSCEPLLGPIDFNGCWVDHPNPAMHENWLEALDWVIVGGESGGKARPMLEGWAIDLVAQCVAVGTSVFMKQGSQANWPNFKMFDTFHPALQVRQWPVSPQAQRD